jgi:type I restriction enzyme, S subunit
MSELKRGYKQTDVGVIPEDWEVKRLGDVLATARLGGNYPNQTREAKYPLMKMGNIGRGRIDLTKVEYIDPRVSPDELHRVDYNDVLFNTRNTLDLVGKVAIWKDELPIAYYNSNLLRLEFDAEQVCSHPYANYALNAAGSVARLRALATGTTSVAAIYTRDLMGLQFVRPPRDEQQMIAAAMEDVDALIGALDRLIAKKRDLKQAAMQQLLTGQTRLPGFSERWGETCLGEIGDCVIGLTYSPEDVVDHGLLVLRSSNIQNNRLAFEDNVCVKVRVRDELLTRPGDILVCVRNGSRALIGKSALIDASAAGHTFGAFMSIFRTRYYPFVFHAFQAHGIQRQIRENLGATINQITNKDMRALRLQLPSEREQLAIASVLSDMDSELSALQDRRNKTLLLKQGMMQELLTGRIRLI